MGFQRDLAIFAVHFVITRAGSPVTQQKSIVHAGEASTMRHSWTLTTVLFATLLCLARPISAQLSNTTTSSLNLTAIAASNGASVLECWQIGGFASSAQAGTAGALSLFLGDAANISYTIIPARFNGGVHRAPAAQ